MQTMLYQMPKIQGKRNKYLNLFYCLPLIFFSFVANAQNTNYTPLYTSGTFVKTIDFTKPVGEIEGNVSATGSGGVSYSVPIFTSPGTNGVQPSIALVYNSQGASGVAGFGWNISGLSAITRTGKNIYHNGIVKPVSYTSDDAFLLDGMRLNAIIGTNGANGTIYAGETETFARIISTTLSSADNPDWFQVTAKDGTVMEFGNSVDSRIITDNAQSVMLWRLNKIIDVNGNYVEFKYDNSNRDSRIQQILYTGNSNTGLLPYNQVNFTYSIRADQNTGYEGGASLSSQYLLDKITIVHTNDAGSTETAKTYRLNYGFDNVHSMLKELVEYGGDETAASLNSTIFLYGDDTQNFSDNTSSLLGFGQDLITGDFDADGKTDILAASFHYGLGGTKYHSDYSIYNNLDGNGVGNFIYGTAFSQQGLLSGYNNTQLSGLITSDYNKDGRDDVLFLSGTLAESGQSFFIYNVVLNTTGSFNSQTGITSFTSQNFSYPIASDGYYQLTSASGNSFIPGDFDGDGNSDYILIVRNNVTNIYKAFFTSPATGEINLEISNFGIGSNPYPNSYAQTVLEADKITPIDFDGDGKLDLLITKNNTSYVLSVKRISAASGYNFAAYIICTTPTITKNCRPYPGDLNGDKKTDLLMHYDNNTWGLLYSNGVSYDDNASAFYFQNSVAVSGYNVIDKITVADFNGDGKADILHGYDYFVNGSASTSKLSFYYNTGKQSTTPFYYQQYPFNKVLSNLDLITGDFNADGKTDLVSRYPTESSILYIKPFSQKNLLQKLTTGHNVTTSFSYKLLTDKSTYPYFYDRTISLDDPINLNPYNYVQLPMYALSTTTVPDGIGGDNVTEYTYENAIIHRAAKGFLGFKKVTIKNNVSSVTAVTENEINTQFAVSYPTRQVTSLTTNGLQLSESFITNSFDNLSTGYFDRRYFQKVDKTLNIDYLNVKAAETVNTYDGYGNVINTISKTGVLAGSTINATEISASTAAFSIHNTPVPAKPDNVTVTTTRAGMPSIATTTTYTYTTNGLPVSQTNFNGLPKAVTTSYNYNNLGNLISTIISTAGLNNRSSNFTYDIKGRFILQKQIAVGTPIVQSETFTYDTKWGKPLTSTSSDCLTTNYLYDVFGDLKQTTLPDGNIGAINNYWHTNNFGVNISPYKLCYTLTHYTGGKPDTKIYIDKFGREWQTETATLYNAFITPPFFHTVQTTFDNRGNIKTKTNSFFPSTEVPRFTTNNYDVYNRLISASNDLGTATVSYTATGSGNLQTTTTSPSGQVSSKITDAAGRVVSTTDDGGTLSFGYDSHGNQLSVNHSGTVVVSSVYDIYDKQTSLTDKDAGIINYTYDGYGQLTQQTDANGNTYNMQYDDLGRNTVRTGPEGTTTYEYYKDAATGCSNNSLNKVTGFNGVIKEYTYDVLKRIASQKETIDAVNYTTSYYYNPYSQIAYTSYPSGMIIRNEYDINSYLIKVYYKQNIFFENGTVDGEGRYLTYRSVNGLTTSNTFNKDFPASTSTPGVQSLTYNFQLTTGNLLQRTDNIKNQNELFTYDNLNRLTASTVNGTQQFGITYDGSTGSTTMGNITSKTDAGYYKYRNDKIHAVAYTMETPVPGQAPVFPAPVSATPQNEQLITYTPFLKTATITETTLMLEQYALAYTYGPDYQRVKSELSQGRFGIVETKIYLGNYEKQIKNGVTREMHYVNGPNGLCGMVVNNGGIYSFYATYTDYLGSITTITDNTAAIVTEQNFDAWGRQRNPSNWNDYNTIPSPPLWLYRGYTGHEMVTLFSLINMNGRMYDPVLGRMLSPDNYISAPYGTQGYNRYSYAMNNPLSYSDPDGNNPLLVIAIFAAVHVSADLIRNDFKMDFGQILGSAIQGGVQGAFSAFGAGAITTAGGAFIAAASSQLPGVNIPIAPGFSIGLSPALAFGSTGWSYGASLNIQAQIGNVDVGFGFGGSFSNNAVTGIKGFSSRTSGMFGMHFGDVSFGLGTNSFNSGITSQSVGMGYFGVGDFKVRYENDWMWKNAGIGDGGDRYRTTGATLSYKDVSLGLNLFTGDPGLKNRETTKGVGRYGTYNEIGKQYRLGAFYAGYGNYRMGLNGEPIRAYFQNHLAHKDGNALPIFQQLNKIIKPYVSYQTLNTYTSW